MSRHEEGADRRMMKQLREKASHLNSQLRMFKIAEAAGEKGIQMKPANLSNMVGRRVGFGVWSSAREGAANPQIRQPAVHAGDCRSYWSKGHSDEACQP